MKAQLRNLLLVVVVCGAGLHAQASIVNAKHGAVPAGRPEAIYHSALHVVAEHFGGRGDDLSFPVTLFLGEENERYVADEDRKLDAIYLADWNENKFAVIGDEAGDGTLDRQGVPQPACR